MMLHTNINKEILKAQGLYTWSCVVRGSKVINFMMPTYFACQKMKMGYALSKKGFIIPRKTNVFGEVLESACLSML